MDAEKMSAIEEAVRRYEGTNDFMHPSAHDYGERGCDDCDAARRIAHDARAELSAIREEIHTRGVTIDHLSAENARMREAVLRMIDCIRCDPTMDGSIRPMGLRSRALVVESIDFARAALGGRDA